MIKEDCIFCKIANGQIPSSTVYEDEDFRVILDVAPAAKGHSLILPKQHSDNLWELGEEERKKVLDIAAKVSKGQKKALSCDGVNLLQNNGLAAGQSVFHFHMHLIPRYKGDDANFGWKTGTLTDDDKEDILARLKK